MYTFHIHLCLTFSSPSLIFFSESKRRNMFRSPYFISFITSIFIICSTAELVRVKGQNGETSRLFVFGDSYADTGNWPRYSSVSWKKPYGTTFPGQPTGRFSDGKVLTDYVASLMGIKSPTPYSKWKSESGEKTSVQEGINFAHGGTGVFNTMVNLPNMTTQINLFQQLAVEETYSRQDLSSSVSLVAVAGNDYASFWTQDGNSTELPAFTKSIMSQLELNLLRIHGLGARKVGVTAMPPLGCLPQMAASVSFRNCTETGNSIAIYHNQMLQQSVQKLNTQLGSPVFVILDLYSAFESALDVNNNISTVRVSEVEKNSALKPCCSGTGDGYSCGSVNRYGMKKYMVCDDPKLSFFWDMIHPSQQGWFAVYTMLKPTFQDLLN